MTRRALVARFVASAVLLAIAGGAAMLSYAKRHNNAHLRLPRGFRDATYRNARGEVFNYGLFVPPQYNGDEPYPLVVFLHGYGERGRDGRLPMKMGFAPAIRRRVGKPVGFLAVFPQSRSGFWDIDSDDARMAMDILADVEANYRIDPRRIYLTGASNGGYGVWNLAARYPQRWAALVPVCGGERAKDAAKIAHIPCWCFHGQADRTIPIARPRRMMAALREAGGSPRFTEYPKRDHSIWDDAYRDPALYDWLLAQ